MDKGEGRREEEEEEGEGREGRRKEKRIAKVWIAMIFYGTC